MILEVQFGIARTAKYEAILIMMKKIIFIVMKFKIDEHDNDDNDNG